VLWLVLVPVLVVLVLMMWLVVVLVVVLVLVMWLLVVLVVLVVVLALSPLHPSWGRSRQRLGSPLDGWTAPRRIPRPAPGPRAREKGPSRRLGRLDGGRREPRGQSPRKGIKAPPTPACTARGTHGGRSAGAPGLRGSGSRGLTGSGTGHWQGEQGTGFPS
jgi:hypothetical protein